MTSVSHILGDITLLFFVQLNLQPSPGMQVLRQQKNSHIIVQPLDP